MYHFAFCLLALISTTCCSFAITTKITSGKITSELKNPIPELESSTQLMVVTTPQWESTSGTITCFERSNPRAAWYMVGTPHEVVVGSNGLAWGIGLHEISPVKGPIKVEGDHCAPAGIFFLGEAFGYDSLETVSLSHFPYRQLSEKDAGVDDPTSLYYNRIIDISTIPLKDWKSSETMKRSDELYRLGIVVEHNWKNIPGRGSCIFMHVWRSPSSGTAGCTAMEYNYLSSILHWLDLDKNPLLIQLPEKEYQNCPTSWNLPSL